MALPWATATALVAQPDQDCRIGTYMLPDGSTVDIGPSDGKTLRWRRVDGTSGQFEVDGAQAGVSKLGWTGRADGKRVLLKGCAAAGIEFDGLHGQLIPFETRETRFASEGVELAGRLVMPVGGGTVPIVVVLQGSEHHSALTFDSLQRRLPSQGVAAFVYDKRGTGASGGKYTQDFDLLARDAVAAMREARRLAGTRAGRVGYQGPSQGGWVAPMAARLAPVDFVMVGFGLAVSVLEEDRSAVALNMRDKGHGPQITAQALELADACGALALDLTLQGYDRFAVVRDRYRDRPWFADVRGDFCFALLPLKRQDVPEMARMLDFGTPWLYDPMATLAGLKTPQLWILADNDVEAPSAETARRLALLRAAGRPISTAVFPDTEHGIYEYETQPDGTRLSTRNPDGYLQLMVDFAKGLPLKPAYGTAVLQQPVPPAR